MVERWDGEMHGFRYACPDCGMSILRTGGRVYDEDGFPYIHDCPSKMPPIPNERDFEGPAKKSARRPASAKQPLIKRLTRGGIDL